MFKMFNLCVSFRFLPVQIWHSKRQQQHPKKKQISSNSNAFHTMREKYLKIICRKICKTRSGLGNKFAWVIFFCSLSRFVCCMHFIPCIFLVEFNYAACEVHISIYLAHKFCVIVVVHHIWLHCVCPNGDLTGKRKKQHRNATENRQRKREREKKIIRCESTHEINN